MGPPPTPPPPSVEPAAFGAEEGREEEGGGLKVTRPTRTGPGKKGAFRWKKTNIKQICGFLVYLHRERSLLRLPPHPAVDAETSAAKLRLEKKEAKNFNLYSKFDNNRDDENPHLPLPVPRSSSAPGPGLRPPPRERRRRSSPVPPRPAPFAGRRGGDRRGPTEGQGGPGERKGEKNS